MKLVHVFLASLLLLATTQSALASCSDAVPGAEPTPSPDWSGNPYPDACYIDFQGGGGDTKNRYEQQCRDLPGFLDFVGDTGSNKNTCVFSMPSEGPSEAPAPAPAPSPRYDRPTPPAEQPQEDNSGRITMTFRNKTNQLVMLKMFSKQRDYVWPGADRHLDLQPGEEHSFTLNCSVGEKICYGAFNSAGGSWSVGRYGNKGCKDCCLTCANPDDQVADTYDLVDASDPYRGDTNPGSPPMQEPSGENPAPPPADLSQCISSWRRPMVNGYIDWGLKNSCDVPITFDFDDCDTDSDMQVVCTVKSATVGRHSEYNGSNYHQPAAVRNYR